MKSLAVRRDMVAATEDWLRRRGVPTLVAERRATSEVWSSARWWLIVVLGLHLFSAFSDRFSGWAQFAVFVGAFVGTLAIVGAFNLVRGRRPFEAPTEIAWPELAFFVLFPPLLVLTVGGDPLWSALMTLVGQLLVLGVVWLLVAVGAGWIVRWAARAAGRHAFDVVRLLARSIPLLLLLTVFMFINAEAWQVAHGMVRGARPVIFLVLIGAGAAFLWFAADDLVDDADVADDWAEAVRRAADSPLADLDPAEDRDLPDADLTRSARINLRLLLVVSVALQATLIAGLLAIAYLALGVVLVPDDVLASWLGASEDNPIEVTTWAEFAVGGRDLFLYEVHAIVAGAVALLGGLNVIVSSLTDDAYRRTFAADLASEIEQDLAVHRLLRAVDDRDAR